MPPASCAITPPYWSAEGCSQGDPLGPFFFAVGYHESLLATQAAHPDVTIAEDGALATRTQETGWSSEAPSLLRSAPASCSRKAVIHWVEPERSGGRLGAGPSGSGRSSFSVSASSAAQSYELSSRWATRVARHRRLHGE